MDPDFLLLDRWQAGDATAGNELFERYFESVHRFFANKVESETDDLVQQTFLGCVEAKDRFQRTASFRTFLFQIAKHQLYAGWRRRTREKDLDFSTLSARLLTASPSTLHRRKREEQLFLDALRAIPVELQVALELHYWEGLGGPELAEILAVPEGTVRSRLRRARELLKERLLDIDPSETFANASYADLDSWATALRAHWTQEA